MLILRTAVITILLLGSARADSPATRPAASDPRTFTRTIRSSQDTYVIEVDGTLDATNTLSFGPFHQPVFQPNLELTIRNTGDVPVRDPRITINETGGWFDTEGLLAAALGRFSNGTREEKCFALWDFFRRHIDAGPTVDQTLWGDERSPVRFMNCFGTGACGTFHMVLPLVGRAAGLDTSAGCLADCSHAVQSMHYDGANRYFDALISHCAPGAQPRGFFGLDLDNRTVSSVASLTADHYLVERAGGGPGFSVIGWYFGPGSHFGKMKEQDGKDPRTMGMTLRPGEALVRTWTPPHEDWSHDAPTPPSVAEGRVVFEPRLTAERAAHDAELHEHLTFDGGQTRAAGKKSAALVYAVYSPYVVIGARIHARLDVPAEHVDAARILLSTDGREWQPLWTATSPGPQTIDVERNDLKAFRQPHLTHRVWYHFELPPGGTAGDLRMEARFQSFIPSLPALRCGRNEIVYHDNTAGPHQIQVVHRWQESDAFAPPDAPGEAVFPPDGGEAGFAPVFEWKPPSGDIGAYEFVLSARKDCAWPVLAPFHSVITGDRPRFSAPVPDALNDGQRYWWRVRARSAEGAWGPWSNTWSFTARGPATPRNLRIETRDTRERLIWDPPAAGRPAVQYQVYAGSDSALSPRTEAVSVSGFGKTVTLPATLLAATSDPHLDITGRPEVWYRVVAVDADGSHSPPTPMTSAPRPVWLPADPPPIVPGEAYSFPLRVRHSTGRWVLRLKQGVIRDGVESVRFKVLNGPDWLGIRKGAHELTGTAPAGLTAPVQVQVEAEIPGFTPARRTFEIPVRRAAP